MQSLERWLLRHLIIIGSHYRSRPKSNFFFCSVPENRFLSPEVTLRPYVDFVCVLEGVCQLKRPYNSGWSSIWMHSVYCETAKSVSFSFFLFFPQHARWLRLISACLWDALSLRYSCAQPDAPDAWMDSYAQQLTAVWIHKPSDWLLLRFINCVIDRCWHNSCQRRKWRLTNDSAGSAVWEITSALCEATRQSSLCLSQCLFTATLNHCRTDNAGKKKREAKGKENVQQIHSHDTQKSHGGAGGGGGGSHARGRPRHQDDNETAVSYSSGRVTCY